MAHATWEEPVRVLGYTRRPSHRQKELASSLGLRLGATTPTGVAAILLRKALAEPLSLPPQPSATVAQLDYLHAVAHDAGVRVPTIESADEFRAWLDHAWAMKRLRTLRQLKLRTGDIVRICDTAEDVAEVSSIGDTGIVYLTGGGREWPDRVEVVVRSGKRSASADALRRQAANRAAHRAPAREWSVAKHEALEAFCVEDGPSEADMAELASIVSTAVDEKPVQQYLEENPQVLAALLRGPFRYVLPQVRIGKDYVADFFLASVDSRGVSWTLLELETPRSPTALSKKNDFDKHARAGIAQIEEWREWLQDNLDQARRGPRQNGLSLPDIRPGVDGIVLVGTRDRLATNANPLRSRLSESKRIDVHTYDWLVETVQGSIQYTGPPAANRYLLQNSSSDLSPEPF